MAEIYNTGNAVPSSDPRDRSDNTVHLDTAVNDLFALTFIDRKGQVRDTYAGIIAKAAKVLATGQIYATTTEGIASGVKWFSIVSPAGDETFILYENVAGVPTERKRFPSAASIAEMHGLIALIIGSGDTAFEFNDQAGFNLVKFMVNGSMEMLKGRVENSSFEGVEFSDEYGMLYAYLGARESMIAGMLMSFDSQFSGIEFQDGSGFIVGKATDSGAYFGRAQSDNPVSPVAVAVAQLNRQKKTDIMQVINYGQSLSRGQYSVPVLSSVQPYSNIMLKGGVLARATDGAYDASAFVPMIAQATGSEGESPVNAMLDGLVRRIVSEDGGDQANWVFAGTSPGRGGRSVAQLMPTEMGGSDGTYDAMLQQVVDTATLAKSLGKSYSIWAYHWVQGENDNSSTAGTSRYDYSERMMALFDRMTSDFIAVTEQDWCPYAFVPQMNANRRYTQTNMRIGMAQWTASKCRDDIVMTCPNYIAVRAEDNNHLSPEGSWLIGEYASRAMKHTMVSKGAKWRPLEPVTVDWTDTHIDVKYHVPQGKIVIDNALVTTAINSGFDLWVSRSTPLALITSVTAIAFDTVRLELSAPASSSAFLSYGLGRAGDTSGPINGARGNVRDTHGDFDKATSPGGVQYDLHNASIAFEYSRKSGF